MTCKHCGSQLPDNTKFCTNCGAPVPNEVPAVEGEPLEPGYFSGKSGSTNRCSDSADRAISNREQSPSMSPMEALEKFLYNIGNYSGRARRSEFWWVLLAGWILALLLHRILPTGWGGTVGIVRLGLMLSLYVRRMHDIGRDWKSLLWMLLPGIGDIIVLILCAKDSDPDTNLYGPNPKY